jgi:hypothetical protein
MHFFNFAEHTIYNLHAIIKLTGTIFINKKKKEKIKEVFTYLEINPKSGRNKIKPGSIIFFSYNLEKKIPKFQSSKHATSQQ